jgi:hypothetical protein
MLRALIMFIVSIAATACALPRPHEWVGEPLDPSVANVRYQGVVYRKLTGEQLRRAVVGATMGFRDIVVSGNPMHYFHVDGRTYRWRGHRGAGVDGVYEVTHDQVCHPMGDRRVCFVLFRDQQSNFLVTDFQPNTAPARVNLFSAGHDRP